MKSFRLLKSLQRRVGAVSIACLAAASFVTSPAVAADYPTKPVKIVIGFSAGGGADLNLRMIAGQAATDLGQQVLVDNRPGASGVIAAQYVLTQPEDGYTILYGSTGLAVRSAKSRLGWTRYIYTPLVLSPATGPLRRTGVRTPPSGPATGKPIYLRGLDFGPLN